MTLTGPDLQQTAREAAEELRGTTSGRPFVEKLNVYKVAGKVFLIVTDDPDEPIITVKADPDRAVRMYAGVKPGRTKPSHAPQRVEGSSTRDVRGDSS